MNSSKTKIAYGVLGLLVIIGFICWIFQQVNGLSVTGMNNSTSWGLYIAMFMLFVGLSAGGLIVASSAHVFNIESFKKIAIPAVICSTVSICCAGAFILIDLGGISRIWRIITGPNPASVLLWDMCIITIYLIINILDLVWMKRGQEDRVKKLSYVALPVAILVHSVTAWIFGLQIAKEWYTAIMGPIFVASALDSGLALLILSLFGLAKAKVFNTEGSLIVRLARLLAVFICVDAYFIGCEVLTMSYPDASAAEALAVMTTGVTVPFFWFEIIAGLLVPFLILASKKNRENTLMVGIACALVVLGVFCKRIWLLFTGFIMPNVVGGNGITLGNQNVISSNGGDIWTVFGAYCPTLFEILIAIAVIALGVIGFMILTQKLIAREK